ncbi:MAG: hypothetical protein ACOYXC_05085 [Candidatus Rifleibacteriota bacterium]
MNQYLLLLGPALGFILGVFFTWFLTYARMRQVEKNATDEKKELENRLEQSRQNENELARVRSRLEESQNNVDLLRRQHEEQLVKFRNENEQRLTLEERVKKIEVLEKVINDLKRFENESVALREKNHSFESTLSEKNDRIQELLVEAGNLKNEIRAAGEKMENLNDRLKELAVVKERARKLEEENCNLLKENEQLRSIDAQLRQMSDIREMYQRTIEENQSFRNQNIARHFIQIKQGLQQSIKAYNRMLHLIDNPLLDDGRIIEIAAEGPELSEEETLNNIEVDASELEKIDGVEK